MILILNNLTFINIIYKKNSINLKLFIIYIILIMFEKIFSTKLIVNIILHVTILYTILANFFMFFISHITSDAINNELKHVINNAFKPMGKYKNEITNKINKLKAQYKELVKSSIISSKINDIKLQIENLKFLSYSLPETNVPVINSFVLPKFDINIIQEYFKNISLDYYLDLFNSDNLVRKGINTQLFSQIHIVNVLLVLFLIVFIGTLLSTGGITIEAVSYLFLENILTFIIVGVVEIMFFFKVAIKFIPVPPSLIFTSLLSSIKSQL